MKDWIVIIVKFSGKCLECKHWIMKDDRAYYKKETGLRCYPECQNIGILDKDKTQLIIHDNQDKEFYLK